MATPKSEKDLHLPLSRVKTIMKSSPEVEAVGAEPLYLVTKVTVSMLCFAAFITFCSQTIALFALTILVKLFSPCYSNFFVLMK